MLHQRFIELGEGYGDIYELCELLKTNKDRLHQTYIFSSNTPSGQALSFAASFNPANESEFMPIYICREGTKQVEDKKPKRRLLFEEMAESVGSIPVFVQMKNSTEFAERELFYQYVTGILRLNHLLPPLR